MTSVESQQEGWRRALHLLTAYAIDAYEKPVTFRETKQALQSIVEEVVLDQSGFPEIAEGFKNYSMALATIAIAAIHRNTDAESLDEILARLQELARQGEAPVE